MFVALMLVVHVVLFCLLVSTSMPNIEINVSGGSSFNAGGIGNATIYSRGMFEFRVYFVV